MMNLSQKNGDKKSRFDKLLHPIRTLRNSIRSEMAEEFENRLIEELSFQNEDQLRAGTGVRKERWEDFSYVYEASSANQDLLHGRVYVSESQLSEMRKKDPSIEKRVLVREGSWVLLGASGMEDADRYQTVDDLHNMQDAAFNKYHTDPHVRNITDNIQFFTIGRGIRFEAANDKVQDVLLKFWAKNGMNKRQKEMVKDATSTYLDQNFIDSLDNFDMGLLDLPLNKVIDYLFLGSITYDKVDLLISQLNSNL